MKRKEIAVITPGVLPVPCSKGGAVETLVEFYLQENEKYGNFIFHVFGIYDEQAKIIASKYKYTKFYFYKPHNYIIRLKRYMYGKNNKESYYNVHMDYYGFWAINKIQKIKIDVLLIENRQGFVLSKPLCLKCTTILHLHNDSLSDTSFKAKELLNKYDKIITVSGYIKGQVDKIAKTQKTKVIYNGIDINRFMLPEPVFTRKKIGFNERDFVVVYSGRISPIKGIRELLQAFLLLKNYPDIKLLVVGGINAGENCDDPFFSEMKSLVGKITNRVVFTGYIPYNTVPSILRLGNVGIIPSICEDAFTLSSVECMASGLPLIVTRSGGIPEAVDENCAIIVEKDKKLVESLSKSILELYKNPEKLKSMADNGKKRSLLFSKTKYSQGFLSEILRI